MLSRRNVLVVVVLALFLGAALFALAPAVARAQGLVEYALCTVFPSDSGTGITDPDDVATLEYFFGVEWLPEYGVYSYCAPMFTGPEKVFTGIRSIAIAYRDLDDTMGLSPGDTQIGVYRQVFRF